MVQTRTRTRGLVAALATTTTMLTGVAATAGPASAHDGGSSSCVTRHEWAHAKVGMRKARVHDIFDTRGRFADGHAGGYTREYRPCPWGGGTDVRLFVGYSGQTNRVVEKRLV